MSTKTALVVEDDKGIQALLRDTLEDAGFQVLLESDGEWAQRALERRLPDLLVTDILLPGKTGFELVEWLRAQPGGDIVTVVMISGIYRGRRHRDAAAERYGVTAYLEKPFTPDELLNAVRHNLGQFPSAPEKTRRGRPSLASRGPVDDPLAGPGTRAERDEVERQADALAQAPRLTRGNLKHTRFPELLSQLFRSRATGALLLRREKVKKIVYLEGGYPVFVKSNLLSECLGRVLVREKIISEAECEVSLKKMQDTGRQQGAILIEMGAISPHNLTYGLQLQLEEKLFEIFGWPDGDYQFTQDIERVKDSVGLEMSLATIIYEGVRRSLSQEQLDDILLPFMESFLAVHDDPLHRFQDIALEADERRLVALVDGRRIMREVIERSELPRLTASQLVYALLAAEMIKPLARKTKGSDRAAPPPLRQKPPPLKPRKDRPPPLKGRGAKREAVLPPSTLDGLDTTEMRTRLATRLHEVKNLDHFEILGVSKDSSTAEIRRAYFAEVGDLHPDRLRAASADVRDLAERLQATLTAAYETLSDSEQRAAYKKSLDGTLREQVGLFVGQILEADGSFERGLRALHKKEWAQAIANFRDAAELYPEDPEPWAYLGWSRFNAGGDFSTEEAEEDLKRSISLGPKSDRGHLYYGLMCAELGRTNDAQKHLEEAVASNPDSREALDGLRMVRGRA